MAGTRGKGNINWRLEVDPDPRKIARAYRELGITAANRKVFGSKGASLGMPWAPVTEMYARRKERRGMGRATMFLTGSLRAALTSSAGVLSMTKRRLVFGTDLPYARAMQFGFTATPGKGRIKHKHQTPPRRLLDWTRETKAGAAEIMQEHAQQLMNAAAAKMAKGGV
jgi:phage gpG-like protein